MKQKQIIVDFVLEVRDGYLFCNDKFNSNEFQHHLATINNICLQFLTYRIKLYLRILLYQFFYCCIQELILSNIGYLRNLMNVL